MGQYISAPKWFAGPSPLDGSIAPSMPNSVTARCSSFTAPSTLCTGIKATPLILLLALRKRSYNQLLYAWQAAVAQSEETMRPTDKPAVGYITVQSMPVLSMRSIQASGPGLP